MSFKLKHIADNVANYRSANKMTQQVLSEKVGVSRHTISSIERAAEKPGIELLLKIANALNTNVDNLLEGNAKSVYDEISIDTNNEYQVEFLNVLKTSSTKQKVEFLDILTFYMEQIKPLKNT